MRSRLFASALSVLLVASLIAPSAVLIMPRQASAQAAAAAVPTGEIPFSLLTLKQIVTSVATYASYINSYILQPIALIKSGNLMKAMTAGVIAYVTGVANGTGATQFVQNLQKNLQQVGDTQAYAFFVQYGRNSNSPFASSITSALRSNYFQNTSAAGFWSANRSTLSLASPNVNAFLGGSWAQGGAKAWFALTTQPQNNPYTLYQRSQAQLASVVTSATVARLSELNWGQGFMSWCGGIPEGADTESTDAPPIGDPCIQSDGTPGIVKTPGSVITSSLNKVLGGQQDKLVQIGSVANDIGSIMSSLASIWQTIQFAQVVLGSSSSSGLYGLGQGLSTNPDGPPNPPPGDGEPVTIALMRSRLQQYESAWSTIRDAANSASTTVTSLMNYCNSSAVTAASDPELTAFVTTATAQANAARQSLTSVVAPVLAQAATASDTVSAARALILRMESTPTPSPEDTQQLQTQPPTLANVISAEQNATASNSAQAVPQGSLSITGGTLVDQMNLTSTNANELRATCTIPGTVDPGPGDPGPGTVVDGGNLPNLYGSATVSQLERVFTSTANQTICFNANLNPQDVGNVRSFFWGTDNTSYTGGNITYWISQTFGGSAMPGYQETRAFTYTGLMGFTVPAAGTYYWCLDLDTTGNKVHVQLWPGSSSSGG